MKLPKIRNPFKRNKVSQEVKELRFAQRLLKKLFSLHIIKIFVIFVILVMIAPVIIFFFYRPKVQENINYGVTFSKKYATQLGLDWHTVYLATLNDLEVKNLRLIAYWDDIEAKRDQYNYQDIKWQLDQAENRNLNVILALGRKVPRYPECFEPTWWKELDNQDYKDVEVLEYVKTTVEELKDYKSIKMWQVENEPFFKFGECDPPIDHNLVLKEIEVVRSLDDRPILVQDSGEGGFWFPSYQAGDYLGISMYRKVWYDFWHVFLGNFIYFQYPLAHWTYKIKADLTLVPQDKIIVTELQAEPWGPAINSKLSQAEKDKTMSRHNFLDTISYAQKAGFKDYYFWGVEWWYWEKYLDNNPFYWDTAKALFTQK
jgi:hypothetical protein